MRLPCPHNPPGLTEVCAYCNINLRLRCERYEGALRYIAVGKISSDNENPCGEGHSMAGRFITAAQTALSGS